MEIRRFNTVDNGYLLIDRHIHSLWTDGEGTLEQIILKAENLGLKQIAFTDHIRKSSTYFDNYYSTIETLRKKHNLEILIGCEAKIKDFDGELDIPQNVIEKAEIIIASVHRFPLGRGLHSPKEFNKDVCQKIELELIMSAINNTNNRANILGHVGGMSIRAHNEFPMKFFEEIIIECNKSNKVFEINYSYHFNIFNELKEVLKIHNPFVIFSSDAHKIDHVGIWSNILMENKCLIH